MCSQFKYRRAPQAVTPCHTFAEKRWGITVAQLNRFARSLTGRLYTSLAGVEKAEYFEAPEEAKTAPKVDFSNSG